ncbi:MAG: glycosyltransferase [Alphaproteobacteria bacterium]|nr:glycosyltransferase [Alphaproteobacteria bacterium]
MRVLMVHSFHHPRGGDTTYTRDLTRLLTKRGHQVIPLAMRHPDNEPSPYEARFPSWVDPRTAETRVDRARALLRMAWSLESARAARAMVRDLAPDVAHVQHLHRHLTPAVLGPLRRAGVPVVWTVHDYELICPSGHLYVDGAPCERCRGHHYLQAVHHRCKWDRTLPSAAVALEKALHHRLGVWDRVDRFLCPSRWLADTLVRFGVRADRVTVLPNPLDPSGLAGEEEARARGSGWLYAGRLAEEKGVRDLLEAARRLPGHRLRICGGGPLLDEVRAAAARLPQVEVLGPLPRPKLLEELRSAAVVAVPSRWPENLPYAVSEAQALGRAVVASHIGGIPELVTDGVDGRLVPPADPAALAAAVGALLADPARAAALGAAGRARVARTLDPDRHVGGVETVYAEVQDRARARDVPLPSRGVPS